MAHLRSVDLPEDSLDSAASWSSDRDPLRIAVDERGQQQGRPVCLIGGCESSHLAWTSSDPDSIGELNAGLRFAAAQLARQRIRCALGRAAWLHRHDWPTSRFHLISHGQIMAMIDPQNWRVYLRRTATTIQIERVAVQVLPARPITHAPDFEAFPMEVVLWELARRCNEDTRPDLLPPEFLKARLMRWNPTPIPMTDLDEHSQIILGELGQAPLTATQLRSKCKLSEAALTRALACLAVSRVTRAATTGLSAHRIVGDVLGWLPGKRR